MKLLTKYQMSCNGYQVSELGNTRISLCQEHGVYQLKSVNVLGAGLVWENLLSFSEAQRKFRQLRTIQRGIYELKNYEVKS